MNRHSPLRNVPRGLYDLFTYRGELFQALWPEYLRDDDTSLDFIRNRIRFWADPLRKHGAQLPLSSEFFRTHFPDVSLTETPAPKILRDF